MKYAIALLLMSFPAWAAPVLKKDLGVYGNWRAAEIVGHAYTGKNACLAWTQTTDGKSTLEVYAEEVSEGVYAEPTIQVVVDPTIPRYIRGVVVDDKKLGEFHFTLMSNLAQPTQFGVLARLDDRAKAIDVLKRSGTANVRLGGEKNVLVTTLKFSLKGSTKGIDAIMKGCNLTVE